MKHIKKIAVIVLVLAAVLTSVSAAFALGETLYATGDVYLRKGAGKENAIITVIKKDSKVTRLDSATDRRGVVWYQVRTESGKTGWASSVYLRNNPQVGGKITMTGNGYIRENANLKGKILGVALKGKTVSYTDTATDARGVIWYLVTYGNIVGWVSGANAK